MELPFFIRMLCQGGMVVTPLLVLSLVVPFCNWNVSEREVNCEELWRCGAGLTFLTFAALGLVGSWGMAARSPSTRWALVLMPSAPWVVLALYPASWFAQDVLSDTGIAMDALLTSVVIYACLFHLPSVRSYFKQAGQIA